MYIIIIIINVLRCRADILWTNCNCVTQLKCCFTSTETLGVLGTGAQECHLDFNTAPELCHSDDDVGLHVLGCRVDILGTNCNNHSGR